MDNKEYADALREIARFYEDNPEFEQAGDTFGVYGISGKENFAKAARMLGKCKKEYRGEMAYLTRAFGGITLTVVDNRTSVCTRKVVGTRKVTREVPIKYETKEVEEDIVEWKCGGSLLQRAKEYIKGGNE